MQDRSHLYMLQQKTTGCQPERPSVSFPQAQHRPATFLYHIHFHETTRYYAIKSREEAVAYSKHPVLGPRLKACVKAVLRHKERSVSEIFGYPDDVKLRSSMTLFAAISASDSVFARVLDEFFNGYQDDKTHQLLEHLKT